MKRDPGSATKRFLILLVVLLTAASCQQLGAPTDVVVTKLFLKPTGTVVATPSPTAVSRSVETDPTPTPAPTMTMTKQASPTPDLAVPTLSPTEVKTLVEDLLINNRGCDLPCWWGILPGDTEWKDAERFLFMFSVPEQGSIVEIMENGERVIATDFGSTYPIDTEDGSGYINYSVHNDVIQAVRVEETGYGSAYSLQQLLNDYGKPKEVKLSTFSASPEYLPFRLFLAYPDLGVYALYHYKGKLEQERIVACPDNLGAELWLWDPVKRPDLADKIEPLGFDPVNPLQPISKVSDWTVHTFYETFRQTEANICIDTSIAHWK